MFQSINVLLFLLQMTTYLTIVEFCCNLIIKPVLYSTFGLDFQPFSYGLGLEGKGLGLGLEGLSPESKPARNNSLRMQDRYCTIQWTMQLIQSSFVPLSTLVLIVLIVVIIHGLETQTSTFWI